MSECLTSQSSTSKMASDASRLMVILCSNQESQAQALGFVKATTTVRSPGLRLVKQSAAATGRPSRAKRHGMSALKGCTIRRQSQQEELLTRKYRTSA